MNLDQAREYLASVVAWPSPGDTSFVNLHWTFLPKDGKAKEDGKLPWTGRAVRTLDEAINALKFASNQTGTRDIYLCLSQQAVAEQKQGRNNYIYYKANRSAQHALLLKSFFLDIDVKPPQYDPHTGVLLPNQKGYSTFEEAAAALMEFITKISLPHPSLIVQSGGGLHVYWTMSRALTPEEWSPYAIGLAEATKVNGLRCDTQCTVDSARVLRIPNTLNHKYTPPRSVRLIGSRGGDYTPERMFASLGPYKGVAAPQRVAGLLDASVFPQRAPVRGANDLASNIDDTGYLVDLDACVPECPFIADALATGGAKLDNPLWNLTTLISCFTKGQRADAHRLGNKHPTYTQISTDQFFDRKLAEKESKALGWPSCATISANGSRACQSCPHLGAGKSPLNFEVRKTAGGHTNNAATQAGFGPSAPSSAATAGHHVSTATASDLPGGYVRDAKGVVSLVLLEPDGSQKYEPVSDYPMTEGWIQGPKPYVLRFDSVVERGKTAQIELPLEITGGMEMRKYLQSQGFMLKLDPKRTAGFFLSWIETLQRQKDAIASSPFGWSRRGGGIEGFVYGGRLWSPTGDRPSATADGVIARQYTPSGTAQPWKDAVKLITGQGRPDLEAIVASSFGAPLVAFTGHLGVLMSAYSQESGIGKSTALKIAQGVWGDPITAVQSLTDTSNSVMGKIGEIRNLPIYWDELKTEEDTKKFVNITFQMGQGKEKSRMTASAKQREPGRWQTLLVSCSNESLLDYVTQHTSTTTAGLYRIFEFSVKKAAAGSTGQVDVSDATIILSRVNDNYGVIGLEYAKWLGQNFATVAKEVADISRALSKEVNANNEERFWLATITCVILGAAYANKLGYANFDVHGIKEFLFGVLSKMRGEITAQPVDMKNNEHVSNTLAMFFNAMRGRHTLITNKIHVSKGKPSAGSIKIINDASKLDYIAIHVGNDDKLVRISSQYLGEWLREKGINRHGFVSAMIERFGATKVSGRVGSGTNLAGPTEYLFQIDIAGNKELNFIDEA